MTKHNWYGAGCSITSQSIKKYIKKYIRIISPKIKKIDGVKEVLLWEIQAEKELSLPTCSVDANIVIITDFDSEDLESIIENGDEKSPFEMNKEELIENGYNYECVNFTKKIKDLKAKIKFDKWVISKDKKLLHWGFCADSKEEWNEIRKDAIIHATNKKNKNEFNLIEEYYEFIKKNVKDAPLGWYVSDYNYKKLMSNSENIR
jgi:hypothetical protein